jgi:hypothetical protein
MLAIIRPQLAEQIVLVIGTSSGKTLVVMIGTIIVDIRIIILVLLMVAL